MTQIVQCEYLTRYFEVAHSAIKQILGLSVTSLGEVSSKMPVKSYNKPLQKAMNCGVMFRHYVRVNVIQ